MCTFFRPSDPNPNPAAVVSGGTAAHRVRCTWWSDGVAEDGGALHHIETRLAGGGWDDVLGLKRVVVVGGDGDGHQQLGEERAPHHATRVLHVIVGGLSRPAPTAAAQPEPPGCRRCWRPSGRLPWLGSLMLIEGHHRHSRHFSGDRISALAPHIIIYNMSSPRCGACCGPVS